MSFIKRRIQLDPGAKGSGGAEFTTLEDLEGDEITGGGSEPGKLDPPIGETEEERTAREATEAKAAADKEEADKETARLAKEETDRKAAEEKNKKPAKDDKPEDKEPEGEEDEAEKFWSEVDALKGGEPLTVDYGDIDPLSPQGVVLRDQALEKDAVDRFENHLAENFPRAYALLEHEAAGGKFEDFIQTVGKVPDLPTEAQLENDIALQEAIVTQNLKRMGNSDKQVQAIIKAAKLDDELEEQAKEALTAEKKFETDNIEAVRKQSELANTAKTTAINQMITYVNAEVGTGEIDGITIPEKDKAAFASEFLKSVRYDNGRFIVTTELNEQNFKKVFKEKFFSYKGGNLGDLVIKAAKTVNATRLRSTIQKNAKPTGSSGDGSSFVSMNDVD